MTEQQYLDIVAGWEAEPKPKRIKTAPGQKIDGVALGHYIIPNPAVYIQFNHSGDKLLMPTAIIRKWRKPSYFKHSYFKVDHIVTERDLIRKVLTKMSDNL